MATGHTVPVTNWMVISVSTYVFRLGVICTSIVLTLVAYTVGRVLQSSFSQGSRNMEDPYGPSRCYE